MDGHSLAIDTAKWWPSAEIPALQPYGLEIVPGFRLKAGAQMPAGWTPTPGEPNPYEDVAWRGEHKAWARELRDVVRPWIHAKGNADPTFAAMERDLCAQDFNYFGAVYGWIFDPKPRADEPMHKPFAKFAYQCHNTTAQLQHVQLTNPDTGAPVRTILWRPKSRQLGISVDDEMFDTAFYLFAGLPACPVQAGQAKLVSRSEKWVYNGSSYEAMFGKILYNLKNLEEHTPYLLPPGSTVHKLWTRPNFRDMVLTNPHTGTTLTGESTTKKVGRGGTYTYARADEVAFIPNLGESLDTLQGGAPHIFAASTESLDEGNDFLDRWQAAKRETPQWVMEFNWHQNAYLDLAWEREVIAAAQTKAAQQGLWRESFRDPFAGFGVWTYPEARELPDANQPYRPEEPLDTTIDPGGTGDITALMACQATAIDGQEGFHVLWSYEREMPEPEWIAHVITGIWPQRGDACYGMSPDAQEQELGRVYYNAWLDDRPLRWFMDPAADQIHSKGSFFTMVRDKTKELRQREYERLLAENIAREESGRSPLSLPVPKPIAPKFEIIKQHRLFGDREFALRKYLRFVTFQTGVPSAARVRECLGRTRYNDLADRAVSEPKRRHDQYSHLASCCEYYAIYYHYRFIDPLDSAAMRKVQRAVGLAPGGSRLPSGFAPSRVPKGFRASRVPAGFRTRHGGGERPAPTGAFPASPGGWRR